MSSFRLRIINGFLRHIERPALSKLPEPADIRRRLNFQSRTLFRPGRRYRGVAGSLGVDGRSVPVREIEQGKQVILYFHGGAYVFGSPLTHAKLLGQIAEQAGAKGVSVDYRLAPEHPFPAAIDDALTAYQALLESGLTSNDIVLGGDSAGGGLALALLARICATDLPRPAGLFALSPWTDLTLSGASMQSNADIELMLPPERIAEARDYYLNGQDAASPLASPLFGSFNGAPSCYLTVGDTEILLDDTLRMAQVLRDHGANVTVNVTRHTPHVLPFFAALAPEAKAALTEVAQVVRKMLDTQPIA